MNGFIIAKLFQPLGFPTSYLSRVPYDGRMEYLAPFPKFATVFEEAQARNLAAMYHGVVLTDPHGRAPEIYVEGTHHGR